MKRIIYYGLLCLTILSGCKNDDFESVLDDPDQRLNETLANYQKNLTSAQYGWKGYLITGGEEVYTFLFNFNNENRVSMLADYSPDSQESSYRLKALQRPTLLFDTYSTLHILQDPDPSKNGGVVGEGRSADFEFNFISSVTDTIKLEGTFNKSSLILIRSKSAEESANLLANQAEIEGQLSKLRTYFKRITIGGSESEVKLNPINKTIAFNYVDGDQLKQVKGMFFIDGNNLVLNKPVKVGNTTVSQINGISYDETANSINGKINGAAISIKEAITPIKYDPTAAARFNANEKQWSSFTGFTKDGIDDYLGITTISGFSRIVFWTKYGPNYDLAGFTFGRSIRFGPAVSPSITEDGLVKYGFVGYLGAANIPSAHTSKVVGTAQNFVKPQGYYVIQTGQTSYDIVSVEDARIWISFE